MKNNDCISQEFTTVFQKEKFIFENVDFWPIVRLTACYFIHISQTKSVGQFGFIKSKSATIYQGRYGLRTSLKVLQYWMRAPKKANGRVAIMTNNTHKTSKQTDKFVNQFTDPFVELFNHESIPFDLFDYDDMHAFGESFAVHTNYYYTIVSRRYNRNKLLQAQLKAVSKYLMDIFGSDFDLYTVLVRSIVYNQIYYRSFKKLFSKNSYSKALYYCYYSDLNLALNRAAKECHVETIEYQHSQISSNHFAYSGWNGYSDSTFFPSRFWAWRDVDVTQLEREFKDANCFNSFKGGNVFIGQVKDLYPRNEESTNKIIVTLQGIGIPCFLEEYLETDSSEVWYLRFHPRYPQDRLKIEALKLRFPEKINIEEANSLSLYELFSQADYHMTCFSGSAIEAQCFGVQNIIFGEKGKVTYAKQIEEGSFFQVETYNELKEILMNKKKGITSSEHAFVDEDVISKTINSVFTK